MSTVVAFPPSSRRVQKELCQYKDSKTPKSDFLTALHTIRNTKELKTPKHAKTVLDWHIHQAETINQAKEKKHGKVYGAHYTKEQTIADDMDCSIRTIERGFEWLKKMGFMTILPTSVGKTAYKVFAGLQVVQTIVKNRINTVLKSLSGLLSGLLSGRESDENPCESKDESTKNEKDLKTLPKTITKNQDIKNNRFKENDSFKQPVKKYRIKKEIKAFLQGYAFYNAFGDDLTKHEVEKRVQLAFIKTDTDYTDLNSQEAVKEALRSFVLTYEKANNLKDKEKYYGALYVCLENALYDYKIEQERLERMEEEQVLAFYDHLEQQEAAGAPENDLEYQSIQTEQTDEQEQNEEPTKEDYAGAFCYGHPFFEHKPFEIFDREFNSFGEWVTPLMPLTDSDELKYYDRIIEQEKEQEEPLEEYAESY